MSSLASTTEKMRSLLKVGAIIAAVLFGIYLLFFGGVIIKNIFFPTAPDLPKEAFGKLPPLEFDQIPDPTISYQINTVSGDLPTDFPDRMLVYKIAQPKPDLLALQNTRRIAATAGFTQFETKISDTVYQWQNPSTNAHIQFNIVTKDFEIKSNLAANQAIISSPVFPEESEIKKDVREYLNSLQVDMEGLDFRDDSIIYYTLSGNTLQQTTNINIAKLVRVNLYNKNIINDLGDYKFVYPNQEFPNVTLIIAYPSQSRAIVLEGESYNHKILLDDFSDYPIKTAAEAFDELKGGNGYLFNPNNLSSIQITEVYLAYYLDKTTTEYAQPVIVFEGINAKGYVPAVKDTPQIEETASK